MDIYLAAAADALAHRRLNRDDRALVPSEDAYYARSTWNLGLPGWVSHLLELVRGSYRSTPDRAPVARHA